MKVLIDPNTQISRKLQVKATANNPVNGKWQREVYCILASLTSKPLKYIAIVDRSPKYMHIQEGSPALAYSQTINVVTIAGVVLFLVVLDFAIWLWICCCMCGHTKMYHNNIPQEFWIAPYIFLSCLTVDTSSEHIEATNLTHFPRILVHHTTFLSTHWTPSPSFVLL